MSTIHLLPSYVQEKALGELLALVTNATLAEGSTTLSPPGLDSSWSI